jgi:hypothetical protein
MMCCRGHLDRRITSIDRDSCADNWAISSLPHAQAQPTRAWGRRMPYPSRRSAAATAEVSPPNHRLPPRPTIATSLCVVPPPVRHPRPQHRAAPPPASRACSWLAPPPPRSPPLDLTRGSADLAVGEHLQRLTLQVRSSPQRHSPPTPSLPVAFPRPPHRIWMEIQPGLGICR